MLNMKKNKKIKINKDNARIELGPLYMEAKKVHQNDIPNEISIIIPRVEFKQSTSFLLFKKTKEIIYNSVTIVIAPKSDISDEEE